jgi:hypothetical protein
MLVYRAVGGALVHLTGERAGAAVPASRYPDGAVPEAGASQIIAGSADGVGRGIGEIDCTGTRFTHAHGVPGVRNRLNPGLSESDGEQTPLITDPCRDEGVGADRRTGTPRFPAIQGPTIRPLLGAQDRSGRLRGPDTPHLAAGDLAVTELRENGIRIGMRFGKAPDDRVAERQLGQRSRV